MRKQDVLVVGQCPPPVHGQAVMIQTLLQAPLQGVRLHHVPMTFSKTLDQVGRFQLVKLLQLPVLICRIIWSRVRYSARVLYYPPAGPNLLPMYRDWAVLLATRWMFSRTIFHFHAGGLAELLPRLNRLGRVLFRLAYGAPDCAIHLSPVGPDDGQKLGALRTTVIPYGIEDVFPKYGQTRRQRREGPPRILFAGTIRESKGVRVLLEACQQLRAQGMEFEVEVMGAFQSSAFETWTRRFLHENELESRVRFLGVCSGPAKWEAYARAAIFCFPSFYESENLPVVIIEAMQFALPVVATRWRGIPAMVRDEDTGFLVDTHSPEQTAACLARLLDDEALREQMGGRGRQIYRREFTLERWSERMEQALLDQEPEPAPVPSPAM